MVPSSFRLRVAVTLLSMPLAKEVALPSSVQEALLGFWEATVPSVTLPFSTFKVAVTVPVKPLLPSSTAVPLSFRPRDAPSSSEITVAGASAGAAEEAAAMASLAALTTAVEVMVAPESASTFSPRVRGAVLPMNWARKASSVVQRVPKPSVSPVESTRMEAIAPSSRVTVTVTSLWKPCAVALPLIPPAEAGASRAAFTASTTAVEVMVAPESASAFSPRVKGPVLPMNWLRKASSVVQRVPKPSVSPVESTVRPEIAPEASTVSSTFTSLAKPLAVADCTLPFSGAEGAAGFSAGAPKVTSGSAAGSLFRATLSTQRRALLVASSTALLVTVAPESASKEPPFTASMPTNCSWKAGSLARAPKPAVSAKFVSPTAQPVTRPSVPTPRVTATSPLYPLPTAVTQ